MPESDPPAILRHQVLVDPTGRRRRRFVCWARRDDGPGVVAGRAGPRRARAAAARWHPDRRRPRRAQSRAAGSAQAGQAAVAGHTTVAPARRPLQAPVTAGPAIGFFFFCLFFVQFMLISELLAAMRCTQLPKAAHGLESQRFLIAERKVSWAISAASASERVIQSANSEDVVPMAFHQGLERRDAPRPGLLEQDRLPGRPPPPCPVLVPQHRRTSFTPSARMGSLAQIPSDERRGPAPRRAPPRARRRGCPAAGSGTASSPRRAPRRPPPLAARAGFPEEAPADPH